MAHTYKAGCLKDRTDTSVEERTVTLGLFVRDAVNGKLGQHKLHKEKETLKATIRLQNFGRMIVARRSFVHKKRACQVIGRAYQAFKARLRAIQTMVEFKIQNYHAVRIKPSILYSFNDS